MNTTPKNILEEAFKEFNLTPPNPMNMLDITNDQCKYPLGDEKDKPELFCGKLCWIDKSGKHHSYCWYHYEITHERKK